MASILDIAKAAREEKTFARERLSQLETLVSQVRDLVNAPRRNHSLLQRRNDFLVVCSAMDILDDTAMALNSYVEGDHDDQGQAYLEIFGVLQALTVQQDAVRQLHRVTRGICLDLEAASADVKEIRDIRVRVAGHPVGGKSSSHFLTRYTVSKKGFELWAYDQRGGRTVAEIDLFGLVARNSVALNAALGDLVTFMEDENRSHKAALSQQKLADIFNTSTYCSGKLFEGVSRRDPIGKMGTRCLRSMIAEFKRALEQRGPHFLKGGFLSYELQTLDHALNRYDEYLDSEEDQSEHDGYILARYIQVEINEVVQMAREIDQDYTLAEQEES
jgi:hypothetical protein